MEVKMRPVKLADIPGMVVARPHDEWAKAAIEQFVESGEEAVELEIPEFAVTYQTVRGALSTYGTRRGVKAVRRGGVTYLCRKKGGR